MSSSRSYDCRSHPAVDNFSQVSLLWFALLDDVLRVQRPTTPV